MSTIRKLLFLLLLQTALWSQTISIQNISQNIQSMIQTQSTGKYKNYLKFLYQQNGYTPLWVGENHTVKMSQLINALQNPLYNYKNKPLNQHKIKSLLYQLDNGAFNPNQELQSYAKLDVLLSKSFIELAVFMVEGDVDWNLVQKKLHALKGSDDISSHWEMKPKRFASIRSLASAAIKGNINTYLESLIPMQERYYKLIKLLKKYRVMYTFPKITYSSRTLKLGSRSNNIENIKKRLKISGEYPRNASTSTKFNKDLQRAIKRFQKRYLLKVTGEIDKTTTYYLNQPANKHIQAIITNLDKTKLYPKNFAQEHIEVNIPDFNLRYYRNAEKIMKMAVVVGRIDRPTPLFSNNISYMVLNPTWTIPDNLIKRDLIHVLRENPSYLEENNIHVFSGKREIQVQQSKLDPFEKSKRRVPYRFVQFPGENNALGRVKFMFPNKYAVYLHDTDNKSLFSRRYRIYSSGCMRVQEPFKLLETLLEHSRGSYSQGDLDDIFETNKPTTIRLTRRIPVHILYFTVYEEDGLAYFKHDIYMYDKIIEESVAGNRKSTFHIPKNRMVTVKKKSAKPLSN